MSEIVWFAKRKLFDWYCKHMSGKFCFVILQCWALFKIVLYVRVSNWQTAQGTDCCFSFTLLLQRLQKYLATVDAIFNLVIANGEKRTDKAAMKSNQKS